MSPSKISWLPTWSISLDDFLVFVDNADGTTKKAPASNIAGGTVMSVTSANTDISVADTTANPVLTLNSGTGANQIVKLDWTGKLPAVDGSQLTNLPTPSSIVGITGTKAQFDTAVTDGNFVYVGDALNATIGATTANTGKFTSVETTGNIELGNASDTTISRVSAGRIAVEWVNVGYLEVPQNSQSSAYTLVLSDSGKHIYHPSADTTARTWTIPANSSVAYPIGTAITFVNDTSAGVITIAITTDTLVLAGAGTTGSRTLAANGVATAIKVTSTRWIISGSGLS